MMNNIKDRREFLASLFNAAVKAADPKHIMQQYLPEKPKGRTIVIGAGKGSAQMASVFEELWDTSLEGVVVTRYGFGVPCKNIEIIEAAHPVPDEAGLIASEKLLKAVENLTEDDLVVALISGGGSALLPAPPDGMRLEDEIAVNKALLASGAPISAMNLLRKHLSRIKGGRLAKAAYPAKLVTFIVSDIPGDNPAFVASGPTVPDSGSRKDALKMVELYNLQLPDAAMQYLKSENADSPMPDDAYFDGNQVHIIASAAISLEAAVKVAKSAGIEAVILSDSIEGEARDVGLVHAAIAREIADKNRPFTKPVLLLSGGETTVTLKAKNKSKKQGRGGRNSEFLLALATAISGYSNIYALAADTDGIDGSEDNAGAFADGSTIERLRSRGVDAATLLNNNDAWTAFSMIGDLFVTGPTGTNVNDFRAILIE